jgi:predicted lipoprotein with Yx(FWY)xxD motif
MVGLTAALAVILAACAKTATPAGSGASTPPASSGASLRISATSIGGLGTGLVAPSGGTLYTLSADAGGKVTCAASGCTSVWPPLLVQSGATPTAGNGVDASMLGTVRTPGGQMQVTYNKWPLYMFSGDSMSGQANGDGIKSFGGVWHPISPAGMPIETAASSTPSSSTGYGY